MASQDLLPHVPNFPGLISLGNTFAPQGFPTQLPNGNAALVPMVNDSELESLQQFQRTGANMGLFTNIQEATQYGQNLGMIKPMGPGGIPGPMMVQTPDFSAIRSNVGPIGGGSKPEEEPVDPNAAEKSKALAEAMKQRAERREANLQQAAHDRQQPGNEWMNGSDAGVGTAGGGISAADAGGGGGGEGGGM